MFCKNCGSEVGNDVVFCPKCGKPTSNEKSVKPLGMKWFKFIIYVQLILAFFINLLGAYIVLSGNLYFDGTTNITQSVYRMMPNLRFVDICYAVACILLAVFSVYVRQQLVNYKQQAKYFYILFLALNLGFSLVYKFAVYLVSDINTVDILFLITVIENVLLIFINNIYFKKREHLFVN